MTSGTKQSGRDDPRGDPGAAAQEIRVLVVDDHEVVRQGIKALLDAEPSLRVVGEAGQCQSAISRAKMADT